LKAEPIRLFFGSFTNFVTGPLDGAGAEPAAGGEWTVRTTKEGGGTDDWLIKNQRKIKPAGACCQM
jgi:hypothetical protein